MVGVPGRSKACENCRRRRIKCDLQEPACQRCAKAGLKCGGSRPITFIHHDNKKPITKKDQSPSVSRQRNAVLSPRARPLVLSAHAHQSLSGSTLAIPQDDIFINYAQARLFQGPDAEDITTPEVDSRLRDITMLALATTLFGADHRDNAIIQRGLQRHSLALERLNNALGDADQCRSFDTLEAVVTMALFEFLISERDRGWVRHARGFETLVAFRGVEAFKSLPELMMFERTRPSMIFAALILRQPTIIARSEWKSTPWTLFPDRKTPMQVLLDIFADCPTLLATKKELDLDVIEDQAHQKHQKLAANIQDLLRKLDRFQKDWSRIYRTCVWEVPSPATTPTVTSPEGDQVPMWPTVLHFQSLEHANVVALGSAVRLFLWMLYQELSCTEPIAIEERISDQVTTAAFTICRTVDYQLVEIGKGASNHLLFYPAKVAFEAIGHNNPGLQVWLGGIINQISDGLAGRWSRGAQTLHIFLVDHALR